MSWFAIVMFAGFSAVVVVGALLAYAMSIICDDGLDNHVARD